MPSQSGVHCSLTKLNKNRYLKIAKFENIVVWIANVVKLNSAGHKRNALEYKTFHITCISNLCVSLSVPKVHDVD